MNKRQRRKLLHEEWSALIRSMTDDEVLAVHDLTHELMDERHGTARRGDLDYTSEVTDRVWQHRKAGGIYTIVGREDGEVYYIGHADGSRWHRPESEFFDGRFVPSDKSPLTPDEAGFHRG